MKKCLAALITSLIYCCPLVTAQEPSVIKAEPATTQSTGDHFTAPSLSAPAVTPELWVYSQEQQRHDDPAQAVRRKAELKADQRLARLAALKWYGQSNSRPDASPTPVMGVYSPTWIGNSWNRYEWPSMSSSSLILQYDDLGIRR